MRIGLDIDNTISKTNESRREGEIMENKIKEAATEIVNKISELDVDTEFTLNTYFEEYDFTSEEKFELVNQVVELMKTNNINYENLDEGAIIGMPWVARLKKIK